MNQKTTIGLVLALVIAAVGVWWAESGSNAPAEKTASGPKSLFDPAIADVAEFEWMVEGATPLKFVMDKDKWRMTAPVAGAAEHFVVNGDVEKIKGLKYSVAYAKGNNERPSDELSGLQKPARIGKLTDKSGKSVVVKIGSRQSLSSKTYVQKEGDDAIYLVDSDLNAELKHGLSDFRGKKVCEFTPTDAIRLEAAGDAQYVFTGGAAKWTLDMPFKARGDKTAISNLVRSLSQLTADRFVDDESKNLRPYGLDKPRLVVSVQTETKTPKPPPAPPASAPAEPQFDVSSKTYKIAFGGSAEDKVFAMMQEPASPAVFQIPESVFKQIAVKLDDLRDKAICEVESARAQKITISAKGESVTLDKQNGVWMISSGLQGADRPTAETIAVEDLLKALKELKAIGFESEVMPSQGFKEPRSTIEVTCEGQVESTRLVIGGVTASKTGAYVRNDRDGTVAVVKAESTTALMVRPVEFLSRELMRFQRDMAAKVELGFPNYSVVASKEDAGWKISAPVQGNAEATAVNAILGDLSMLRGRRVVGMASEASKFGLTPPTVRVSVTVNNPPKPKPQPPTTQPGPDSPPEMEAQPPSHYAVDLTKMGDVVYAMAAGGSTVCEVDAKVIDDCLSELLDTKIASLEPSQARRLAFEGSEKFSFEKSGDTWKLLGEPTFGVDPVKVTETFTLLNTAKCTEYVRYMGAKLGDYGLDKPSLSVTAECEGGSPMTLMISAKGPDKGGRYGCLSTVKDRVFVIKQEDVDKLTKRVQDFQKAG